MASIRNRRMSAWLPGQGLVLTVNHKGNQAWQELFAHPDCLARALHARTPFDPEMFFD